MADAEISADDWWVSQFKELGVVPFDEFITAYRTWCQTTAGVKGGWPVFGKIKLRYTLAEVRETGCVTAAAFSRFVALFGPMTIAMYKMNAFCFLEDSSMAPCFHGFAKRADAVAALRGAGKGAYLVRYSSHPDKMSLSMATSSSVSNTLVYNAGELGFTVVPRPKRSSDYFFSIRQFAAHNKKQLQLPVMSPLVEGYAGELALAVEADIHRRDSASTGGVLPVPTAPGRGDGGDGGNDADAGGAAYGVFTGDGHGSAAGDEPAYGSFAGGQEAGGGDAAYGVFTGGEGSGSSAVHGGGDPAYGTFMGHEGRAGTADSGGDVAYGVFTGESSEGGERAGGGGGGGGGDAAYGVFTGDDRAATGSSDGGDMYGVFTGSESAGGAGGAAAAAAAGGSGVSSDGDAAYGVFTGDTFVEEAPIAGIPPAGVSAGSGVSGSGVSGGGASSSSSSSGSGGAKPETGRYGEFDPSVRSAVDDDPYGSFDPSELADEVEEVDDDPYGAFDPDAIGDEDDDPYGFFDPSSLEEEAATVSGGSGDGDSGDGPSYDGLDPELMKSEDELDGMLKHAEELLRSGHAKAAVEQLFIVREEAQTADLRRIEARAANNIGAIFHKCGKSESAVPYLRSSADLLRELSDDAGEFRALNSLVICFLKLSMLEHARKASLRQLTLASTEAQTAKITKRLAALDSKLGSR